MGEFLLSLHTKRTGCSTGPLCCLPTATAPASAELALSQVTSRPVQLVAASSSSTRSNRTANCARVMVSLPFR